MRNKKHLLGNADNQLERGIEIALIRVIRAILGLFNIFTSSPIRHHFSYSVIFYAPPPPTVLVLNTRFSWFVIHCIVSSLRNEARLASVIIFNYNQRREKKAGEKRGRNASGFAFL